MVVAAAVLVVLVLLVVLVAVVVGEEGSVVVEEVGSVEWRIVTVKIPPVLGRRETSPREVENVERSSWANCMLSH